MMKLGIPDTLPPLTFRELRGYLWFGVAGLLLLSLGVLPDRAAARWAVALLLACWLMVPVRGRLRRSAGERRSEGRRAIGAQIGLFTLIVVTFSIVFAIWARHLGLAWPVVIGALFLIDSFANVIASLTEWWRLSMIGHSFGLMTCGFVYPFVAQGERGMLCGGGLLAGSLLSGAILYWQVRRHEKSPRVDGAF